MSENPLTGARADLRPGELDEKLGIRVLRASADELIATMPVATNTQSFGLLHGGASAALAEAVGSWAAVIHAGPGRTAVGVELNVTHHRSAREGTITATATPLHRGRTMATYQVSVVDDAGRAVCSARMTCYLSDERR
ncbi:PaaI family thioesterase [Kineococcus auxinigenes]|uniref:PaaI family thioesterase n=1 Tax=unclassified Kineococcus TaxID=2621656 RepID=UPI003D7D4F7D